MDKPLADRLHALLGRLAQTHAIPELSYGTLPTAMAIRGLELQHLQMAEQRLSGNKGIPSEEAFGAAGAGVVLTVEVAEALQSGTLESLFTLPSDAEVIKVVSRVEDLLPQGVLTQTDLLAPLSRQFEELVAEIFDRLGYVVELTAQTRDGGKDIVAIRRTSEVQLRLLIECKRYRPERKIEVGVVRQLYGVKVADRATQALLATTSTFSNDALAFINNIFGNLKVMTTRV